jgi:hypothetical protein
MSSRLSLSLHSKQRERHPNRKRCHGTTLESNHGDQHIERPDLSKKITGRVGEALEGATEQMESAVDRAAERQSLLTVSAGKARHTP